MAPPREDGGGTSRHQRIPPRRELSESSPRSRPLTTHGSVADPAASVGAAWFLIASADRISQLPDASGCSQRHGHRQQHDRAKYLTHDKFTLAHDNRGLAINIHSRAQAKGQRTRGLDHQRTPHGLIHASFFSPKCNKNCIKIRVKECNVYSFFVNFKIAGRCRKKFVHFMDILHVATAC